MAGGQEKVLRRRIRTVQATKKITRAFELIAASQIVRSQNRLAGFRPYLKGIAEILAEAAADAGHRRAAVLGVPESPRHVLVVAVVADRGLCGAYNANVLRLVERTAARLRGRRGRVPPRQRRPQGPVVLPFPSAQRRAVVLGLLGPARLRGRPQGGRDHHPAVPRRGRRPRPGGLDPVPVRRHAGGGDSPGAAASRADGRHRRRRGARREGYTEFEPESPDLLVELVPRYVEAAMFGALLEAAASEHTARQRAMAAATDNADELAKKLTRDMNRARQDAITTEIMEIVGGAEALRQAAKAETE